MAVRYTFTFFNKKKMIFLEKVILLKSRRTFLLSIPTYSCFYFVSRSIVLLQTTYFSFSLKLFDWLKYNTSKWILVFLLWQIYKNQKETMFTHQLKSVEEDLRSCLLNDWIRLRITRSSEATFCLQSTEKTTNSMFSQK